MGAEDVIQHIDLNRDSLRIFTVNSYLNSVSIQSVTKLKQESKAR